jgi:hypothetical protein
VECLETGSGVARELTFEIRDSRLALGFGDWLAVDQLADRIGSRASRLRLDDAVGISRADGAGFQRAVLRAAPVEAREPKDVQRDAATLLAVLRLLLQRVERAGLLPSPSLVCPAPMLARIGDTARRRRLRLRDQVGWILRDRLDNEGLRRSAESIRAQPTSWPG